MLINSFIKSNAYSGPIYIDLDSNACVVKFHYLPLSHSDESVRRTLSRNVSLSKKLKFSLDFCNQLE